MAELILYIAVSEDFFIAKKNGDVQWLHDPKYALEGEDFGYSEFYKSIGITLMGRKTYDQVMSFDLPFPYVGKTNYVFTRETIEQKEKEHVTLVADPIPFVRELKTTAAENIWLIGGAAINTLLMEANLVDKIILTRVPIKLEEGISFCEPLELLENFEAEGSRTYDNGFVQLDLLLKKK